LSTHARHAAGDARALQKKLVNIKADYAKGVDKWNIQLISDNLADTRNYPAGIS
jgi:hypothetical protein